MDRLRKVLANIQTQLGGMTATQKLLVGSLVVILLMTLFLVSQYAGKVDSSAVWPGEPAESQDRAALFLTRRGYTVTKNPKSEVTVPAPQVMAARADLAEAD